MSARIGNLTGDFFWALLAAVVGSVKGFDRNSQFCNRDSDIILAFSRLPVVARVKLQQSPILLSFIYRRGTPECA